MTDQETDKEKDIKVQETPDPLLQKAVKAQKNRRDGYLLLFLALVLLAVGAYFRSSEPAHHKLLVRHEAEGSVFDQSVIFMLKHDKGGAYGLMLNLPDENNPGYFYGGPVDPDRIAGLYTGVLNFEGGLPVGDTGIYYVEGPRAEELRKLDPPPPWYIVTRGYAGWAPRQLDREMLRGGWKIAEIDLPLVTETSPEFMWRAATEKITAAEETGRR